MDPSSDKGGNASRVPDMLKSQYEELRGMVQDAEKGENAVGVQEMMRMYHAALSISAMTRMLQADIAEPGAEAGIEPGDGKMPKSSHVREDRISNPQDESISDIKRFVSERFDATLHPRNLEAVTQMISGLRASLLDEQGRAQEHSKGGDGKFDAPGQSGIDRYDELRNLMSVREFIEQYDVVTKRDGAHRDG